MISKEKRNEIREAYSELHGFETKKIVDGLLETCDKLEDALDAACGYLDITGEPPEEKHHTWKSWWLECAEECEHD